MGNVVFADFKTKSWHRPETLEEMAVAITEQLNQMADAGTEVVCEMIPYHGAGIDGIPYWAPDQDPA